MSAAAFARLLGRAAGLTSTFSFAALTGVTVTTRARFAPSLISHVRFGQTSCWNRSAPPLKMRLRDGNLLLLRQRSSFLRSCLAHLWHGVALHQAKACGIAHGNLRDDRGMPASSDFIRVSGQATMRVQTSVAQLSLMSLPARSTNSCALTCGTLVRYGAKRCA